jgi:hypothetical protein
MYPILSKSSSIDINPAITIYNTFILPITTYAAPAWKYASKTQFNKLQVFFQMKSYELLQIFQG